jgi:serine/threonine protein kinase/WD40 repeat protein
LLDANAAAGEFLLHPAAIGAGAAQKTMFMPPLSELTGTRIGHYKLLEQIGEGGFGVVWMAEQEEPVRRRVALKIIKLGMDTREVVARFEAERQALAMMEHPNIASVFDGGATDTGRPYFVMELVKGVPITDYCDANHLSTRERLELFMQVCHAVQHAHQKGVIHRDLKPSNILVTVKDDRPVPKVIDFGVAKATQARLTEKTVFTRFHQWIGTPAYMSPEQAGLGSLDVDTRSDIYSLGVLLYELLTGRTPFDTQKLLAAGYDEVMRTIREQDPPKPSARLSTLAKEELGAVAARRGAEPAKLGRLVRGDLDWIVMKALEKDRTRRYETANGLALDLERHLGSEPIAAAAPNTFYLVRKYVRRHRTGLVTSASLLLLLLAGTVLSTWQAIKVTNAESKTRTALGLADQARQSAERNQRAAEFALYSGRISRAADLWDKGDVKQAENVLDVCPDLLRGWEWRWLKRQCHQEVMSFDGFSSDEESTRKQNGSLELNTPLSWAREGLGFQSGPRLAFSADGTRLIAGNPAGGLCVFDIQTGKPLVRLQGNKTLTSEDGSLLIEAPSGEHAVSIVEIATGNRRSFLLPVESTGDRICFAASLRWAAFSKSDGVTVVSLVDGVRVGFLNCTNEPTLLALSTDSTWLVTTTSGADRDTVWNIRSGKPVFDIKSRPDGVTPPGSGKIIFSRDNRRLAVMGCLPGTQPNDEGRELLQVWDLNTARRLFARRCFPGSIAFIGDRYILAPSKSSLHPPFSLEMVLLDAQSGEEVYAVCADNGSSHDERFFGFGFPTGDYWAGMIYGATSISTSLDDHYLALGSMDCTVQIIETLPPFRRQLLRGHYNPVCGVAFSPDAKRLASMDERGTVKIWELSRLETLDLWHRWPEEFDRSELNGAKFRHRISWGYFSNSDCGGRFP